MGCRLLSCLFIEQVGHGEGEHCEEMMAVEEVLAGRRCKGGVGGLEVSCFGKKT